VTAYIVRRLAMALVVIVLVSVLIFLMMHLLPGDPLAIYAGDIDLNSLSPEELQELRHEIGLDKSLAEQYFSWVGGIFHGDFGYSLVQHQEVSTLMKHTYAVTLYIGMGAFVLSALLGIGVGLLAGLKRGKWIDQTITVLTYLGVATPNFWLGILLIWLLSLKLGLLPVSGFTLPTEDLWMSIRQGIMPVICMAIAGLAATARQMRTSIVEVIRQDYIRTARSKGLGESTVVWRHGLKNSLIPVVTIIGVNVRAIFGGSVVVESVFAIPGVGRLLVNSVFAHDYTVVQSIVLVMTCGIVLANLIVDLSYGWLDPRIRYS
jgi:peptide/nickel transport system permease protein